MTRPRDALPLYLSAAHRCSYLPDRQARSLFADPEQAMTMSTYSELLRHGFRRSGRIVYAPKCDSCRQCVSVRVPVADFAPRRNHRRVLAANRDVEMRLRRPEFDPDHFALYQRYTRARHEEGDMADASAGDYLGFLRSDWCDTRFIEFRLGRRLIAVAVTDRPDDGLSAVYTFFEPTLARRSLGTLAILRQIDLVRDSGLDYLYLGYWIRDSRKMAYKSRFRPIELWRDGRWLRIGPTATLPAADSPF